MSQNRKEVIDCSVIIPHFNQIDSLVKCLDGLKQQVTHYSFEIIVVNNRSSDDERITILEKHPNVRWIENSIYNPYTSRNIGIQHAKSSILAFLDAKCIPNISWLEMGCSYLSDDPLLIIAGKYDVAFDTQDLGNYLYPLLYLNNEKNVSKGYGITAGNFMTTRKIFDDNGVFLDDIHTGNDIEWSKRCLDNRVKINYLPEMTVVYPGQSKPQLKTSITKYMSGIHHLHKYENRSVLFKLQVFFKYLLPMRMNNYLDALRYRNQLDLSLIKKTKIWFLIWQLKLRMAYFYLFPSFTKSASDQ